MMLMDLDVLDLNKFGLFCRGWKGYVPRMCVRGKWALSF